MPHGEAPPIKSYKSEFINDLTSENEFILPLSNPFTISEMYFIRGDNFHASFLIISDYVSFFLKYAI